MKLNKLTIGLVLAAGMTLSTHAAGTNVLGNVQQAGMDLWNIFKSTLPNGQSIYTPVVGYGINSSSGNQIEFGGVSISNTNGAGLLLVGGHIGSSWVYGGGGFQFSHTDNLPVIGNILGTTTESIGDGVIYDWKTHDPANYSFTSISKNWDIYKGHPLGVGFIMANRSNASGVDLLGAIHYSF